MFTQNMDSLGNEVNYNDSSEQWLDGNQSFTTLPPDMVFNKSHVVSIICYSILMVISAVGNITVLVILGRRSPRTRINNMLIHLAIADLSVALLMMPLEIIWTATVSWYGDDTICRVMQFFRVFGHYLSGFVLICISVDRYYAVMKPLQMSEGLRRNKRMIVAAWLLAVACSSPQMFIFNGEYHPTHTFYYQCVSIWAFGRGPKSDLAYNIFNMFVMYLAPLTTILFCYTSILREIMRRSRDALDGEIYRMRRSSTGFLGRARTKTLKMTITLFLVFFFCWTPYYFISVWFWLDHDSASSVDGWIANVLFVFACTNSCVNPLVYGVFNLKSRSQGSGTVRRTIVNHSCNKKDFYCCGESIELPTHSYKVRFANNHK